MASLPAGGPAEEARAYSLEPTEPSTFSSSRMLASARIGVRNGHVPTPPARLERGMSAERHWGDASHKFADAYGSKSIEKHPCYQWSVDPDPHLRRVAGCPETRSALDRRREKSPAVPWRAEVSPFVIGISGSTPRSVGLDRAQSAPTASDDAGSPRTAAVRGAPGACKEAKRREAAEGGALPEHCDPELCRGSDAEQVAVQYREF
jgi:hypothetical protein